MSESLARRLANAGVVTNAEVTRGLFVSATRRVPFVRALIEEGLCDETTLEATLRRAFGPPVPQIRLARELMRRLPPGMCASLHIVPTGVDPETGDIEVALVDPTDLFARQEVEFHLAAKVRPVRATLRAIEEALSRPEIAERERRESRAPTTLRFEAQAKPSARPSSIASTTRTLRPALDLQSVEQAFDSLRESQLPSRRLTGSRKQGALPLIVANSLTARSSVRIKRALMGANSRTQMTAVALKVLSSLDPGGAIFAVKREEFLGLSCTSGFCEASLFREFRLPRSSPSLLSTAVLTGSYVGPVPRTEPHRQLRRLLGKRSSSVVAKVVRARTKPVFVLLSSDPTERVEGDLERLASLLGEALANLLARPKS